MSDDADRRRERHAGHSLEDRAALLRSRIRTGRLTTEQLTDAARLGEPAARALVGAEAPAIVGDVFQVADEAVRAGPNAMIAFLRAIEAALAPTLELANESSRVVDAIARDLVVLVPGRPPEPSEALLQRHRGVVSVRQVQALRDAQRLASARAALQHAGSRSPGRAQVYHALLDALAALPMRGPPRSPAHDVVAAALVRLTPARAGRTASAARAAAVTLRRLPELLTAGGGHDALLRELHHLSIARDTRAVAQHVLRILAAELARSVIPAVPARACDPRALALEIADTLVDLPPTGPEELERLRQLIPVLQAEEALVSLARCGCCPEVPVTDPSYLAALACAVSWTSADGLHLGLEHFLALALERTHAGASPARVGLTASLARAVWTTVLGL